MSLKGRSCWVVNIRMVRAEILSLGAMGRFLSASEEVRFEAADRRQLYQWVEEVLVGHQYIKLLRVAIETAGSMFLPLSTALPGEAAYCFRLATTFFFRERNYLP